MAKKNLNTYWGEVSTLHLPKIATNERNFITSSYHSIIANRFVTKNRYRSLISSSLHLCIANRLALATSFLLLLITSFLVPSSLHSQIPAYVPTDGLVGYWSFNGNANDESGNGNNGTVNGATLTTDRDGNANSAYYFNGNSIINVNNPFFNNGWAGNTINIWASIEVLNPSNTLLNTDPHCGVAIGYSYLGNQKIYHYRGADPINNTLPCWSIFSQDVFNSNLNPLGQWIMITIVKSDNSYMYYLNGNLDKTSISSTSALNGICSMVFGAINNGTEGLTGKLDDIAIYNRALNQEEITALYNGTTNTPIAGCTNSTACNYNASATQDDGSCTFPAQTYLNCAGTCINDADNDGICDELETPTLPSYLPSNGLVGYWPFNGNANDESGNGNHGTVNGATLTTDRNGNSNSAYGFQGANQHILIGENLNNGSEIGYPNTSWSLNLWFLNDGSNQLIFFSDYNSIAGNTNNGENDLILSLHNQFFDNSVFSSIRNFPFGDFGCDGIVPNIDSWKMYSCIYSQGTISIYINGTLLCSSSFNNALNYNENPVYRIGSSMWNGNYSQSYGQLDDIAIYNRALTPEEITALYNGTTNTSIAGCTDPTAFNFNANANQDDGSCIPMLTCNITAPTTTLCAGESVTLSMNTTGGGSGLNALPADLQQGLVAYYPFNGNANDESGNGNNGTVNGATLTADRFGNANGAYSFDGGNTYITTSDFINFSQDFSINFWVRTTTSSHQVVLNTIPHNVFGYAINPYWGNVGQLGFIYGNGQPAGWIIPAQSFDNPIATLNEWVMHTITKQNSNLLFYQNDDLIYSNSSAIIPANSPVQLIFGQCDPAACNESFLGNIDDAHIYNRALTPTEIQQLYTAQSFNWSNGATANTTTVSPTTNTTYSCTVTQGAQTCTASVDIVVNPLLTFYADADGDGFGDGNAPLSACIQPTGSVTNNTDCNDNDALLNSITSEICNNLDDDCDGNVDNGLNFVNYYNDQDGDGFGAGSASNLCNDPGVGYVTNNTDCDDSNESVNVNSTELCNAIDDDCDLLIDEDLPLFTWFLDNDGDGIGTGSYTESCAFLPGYATIGGDCNDNDATISPVANEICNNVDENCDGVLNDGLWIAAYIDADGDGYGANNISVDGLCELTAGFVGNNQDCDDNEPLAYTGAFDVCDNGIDEDCSGSDNTCIVLGCTDPNACNYNESANTEDFSCTYPQMDYLNCQGACNNDTDGDGVCDEIELLGCTDVTASNFNPEATEDDGSCIFNIEGCTDIQACNFDPAANFDNGSCILPQPETCNGLDDDCDDLIDEGLTPIGLNVIPIVTSIYPVCSGNSIKSANLNNGINSEVIDGNGNDLWFSLNAQFNTLRAGLSAATGDNDIRLYQLTTNGCLQHIETEHEFTPGNQTLISDQLTIGTTYYIAIHHLSGNMNASAKICFNHLTGSTCDHYYSNNTGVYTSVCNSFKAQFRSNATAYMFEVLSASQNGSNTNITPWSYTTPTANSVVSRLGAILPANQTGSPIQYVLRVPVVYSMFDAAGNVESILANATGNCNLTLNNENTIALRVSDRCPATKSLSGNIAPDRTVCGAVRYDWEFTQVLPVESTPQIINGGNYTPIFFLSNVPGIATGKTYSVRVRPVHSSGSLGNWGVSHCLRVGNSGMMMQEIIEQSQDVISLFTIYPNPATSGSFILQTNWSDEKEENVQVSIQDITGKIVFNQNIVLNNNNSIIEFGNLADGIYMVTIGDERRRLQILKK